MPRPTIGSAPTPPRMSLGEPLSYYPNLDDVAARLGIALASVRRHSGLNPFVQGPLAVFLHAFGNYKSPPQLVAQILQDVCFPYFCVPISIGIGVDVGKPQLSAEAVGADCRRYDKRLLLDISTVACQASVEEVEFRNERFRVLSGPSLLIELIRKYHDALSESQRSKQGPPKEVTVLFVLMLCCVDSLAKSRQLDISMAIAPNNPLWSEWSVSARWYSQVFMQSVEETALVAGVHVHSDNDRLASQLQGTIVSGMKSIDELLKNTFSQTSYQAPQAWFPSGPAFATLGPSQYFPQPR